MARHLAAWLCVLLSLLLSAPLASIQAAPDFSDPLWTLYNEVQSGMLPGEVNLLLKKHAPAKQNWEIHEGDLRERTDIWDVHRQDYSENVFYKGGSQDFIAIDLIIYFAGMRVGCILYKFRGEGVSRVAQRGDKCHLFQY